MRLLKDWDKIGLHKGLMKTVRKTSGDADAGFSIQYKKSFRTKKEALQEQRRDGEI